MSTVRLRCLPAVLLAAAAALGVPARAGATRRPLHLADFQLTSELLSAAPADLAGPLLAAAAETPAARPRATAPSPALPDGPHLTARERAQLEDRLASNESWRSAGKAVTWVGILASGVGLLMLGSGAAAAAAGAVSFDLGRFTGGAVLLNMGAVVGGVGLLALAVGIPIWAINAGRANRLRRRLERSRPTVTVDPRTGATLVGWSLSF